MWSGPKYRQCCLSYVSNFLFVRHSTVRPVLSSSSLTVPPNMAPNGSVHKPPSLTLFCQIPECAPPKNILTNRAVGVRRCEAAESPNRDSTCKRLHGLGQNTTQNTSLFTGFLTSTSKPANALPSRLPPTRPDRPTRPPAPAAHPLRLRLRSPHPSRP